MPARPGPARRARMTFAALLVAVTVALAWPGGPAAALGPREYLAGEPVVEGSVLASSCPEVTMPAGVLWTDDGRRLWERDADTRRAMASTTKIMTALVVLDEAAFDETVTVSARAARVGEAGIEIEAGQRFTVEQLMVAMLVRSANDAAFALAEHVGGSVDGFVRMMNEKAVQLGLTNTSFANPHGLDAPGHYTTASDLATLAKIAMSDARFARIVATPSVCLVTEEGPKTWANSNRLIGTYQGATGVKTGWTGDAGYCVVASARRGEIGLIAVVLGGRSESDRVIQATTLLDWGFEHYRLRELSTAEETAAVVPVSDYLDRSVEAVIAETVTLPVFDVEGVITTHLDVVPDVTAPVRKGDRLGTLTVVQGDRVLAQVPVLAASGVPAPDRWEATEIWLTRVWRYVSEGVRQVAYELGI